VTAAVPAEVNQQGEETRAAAPAVYRALTDEEVSSKTDIVTDTAGLIVATCKE
jgi:hypothetical protein